MFSLFNKTKVYPAAVLHAEILMAVNYYAEQLKEIKKKELENVPQTIQKEYDDLTSLGLGNTKNAQILKDKINEIYSINQDIYDYNEQVEFIKNTIFFMKCLFEVFGTNVMLIKFDDFEKLINKYNLVCGTLDQYTGSIPEKTIEEIKKTKEILNQLKSNERTFTYYNPTYKCLAENIYVLNRVIKLHPSEINGFSKEMINRFPFAYGSYVIPLGRKVSSFYSDIDWKSSTQLFIVAPAKDMKVEGVEFTDKIRTEDPFICSYTPYGIVIYSKWGEEAEDEILKKYYDLVK